MKRLSFARLLAGAIIGAFAGPLLLGAGPLQLLLGDTFSIAVIAGAAFGVVGIVLLDQAKRLRALEQQLAETGKAPQQSPSSSEKLPAETSLNQTASQMPADTVESDTESESDAESELEPIRAEEDSWRKVTRPAMPAMWNDFAERFGRINLPVKIGVLILFIGLAALLRFAADQGWLSMPIELRLAGIALLGILGLWIGWQQRDQRRVFALSLQGGAIGILVLTLFAAFRLYDLLPQSVALILVGILVFGGGVLAVVQRSQALALFVMVAGFAAPILLAGDSSNPIGLFSWYAILNIATFSIALKHYWPLLTRLGFLVTFVIGTLWGVLSWQPQHYWTAQIFLILFFALYFLIPIIQASSGKATDRFDVLLIFGLPLFAFPLQIALLLDNQLGIAFAALVAAVIYLFGARWLFVKTCAKSIGQSYAVLAVGLATLAVPFAFSGPTVVLIWALEGAALIWFGCISHRRIARIAGLVLIGLAALIWFAEMIIGLFGSSGSLLLFNASGLGGLAIAVASWLAAWQYQRAGANSIRFNLLFVFGFIFWLLNGLNEIDRFFDDAAIVSAIVGFCALSVAITGWIHWRQRWAMAAFATIAMLGLSALLMLADLYSNSPLSHFGWAVWLAMLVIVLVLDRLLANAQSAWRMRINITAHLAIVVMLTQQIGHWLWTAELASGWNWLLAGAPLLLLNAWMQTRLRPPLALAPVSESQRASLCLAFILPLIVLLVASLSSAGNSAPLPWLPLLNPLELAQCFALILIVLFVRSDAAQRLNRTWRLRKWLPAALVFVFITVAALRSVHHLVDVAWNVEALFDSALAQATLTVVWTLLGVIAWVVGSKQHRHLLWRAGAVLLAIVLIKLLLIDRQFLSNVAGILSFVAFGLLSILVGFLAPAPPSEKKTDDVDNESDSTEEAEQRG